MSGVLIKIMIRQVSIKKSSGEYYTVKININLVIESQHFRLIILYS